MRRLLQFAIPLVLLGTMVAQGTLVSMSASGLTVNTVKMQIILGGSLNTFTPTAKCNWIPTRVSDCSDLSTRVWKSVNPAAETVNATTGLATAVAYGITNIDITDPATSAVMNHVAIAHNS